VVYQEKFASVASYMFAGTMCGRYSLSIPVRLISHLTEVVLYSNITGQHGQIHHMVDYPDIDVAEANWIDEDNFRPRSPIAINGAPRPCS
jgi:hypothetical protein